MIQYILDVTISWTFFYLIFFCFLRKETFFNVNRFYLIASITIGLILPFLRHIQIDFSHTDVAEVAPLVLLIQESPTYISQSIETVQQESISNLYVILVSLYSIGFIFFLLRLCKGLLSIYTIYRSGTKVSKGDHVLIHSESNHLPFSFLNMVFISTEIPLKNEYQEVITHELEHVRSRHSLDVLYMELINVVFWFNPLIYLYKSAIKQTHEYLADAMVLHQTDKKMYGHILLRQSLSGIQIALAHSFFHSHLKNRIKMMYQKKSGKWAGLKYLLVLPVIALVVTAFGLKKEEASISNNLEIPKVATPYVDSHNSGISNNQPRTNEENDIVNSTSQAINANLLVDDNDLSEALADQKSDPFETIKSYRYETLRMGENEWEAEIFSEYKGPIEIRILNSKFDIVHTVRVNKTTNKITLPLDYKANSKDHQIRIIELNSRPAETIKRVDSPLLNKFIKTSLNREVGHSEKILDTTIFNVVDKMPRFIGCDVTEHTDKKSLQECSNTQLIKFIFKNLKYPLAAKENKIEGKVFAQFIVEKDGYVSDAKIIKDIGSNCGEAVLDVVNKMNENKPHWIPGEQDGKKVRVKFTLPVAFKLQDENETKPDKKEIILDPDKDDRQPLFVVDGVKVVPSVSKKLDPDDIARINVLKGEKAFEKYGEESINGVVEIFTKKANKFTLEKEDESKEAKKAVQESVDTMVIYNADTFEEKTYVYNPNDFKIETQQSSTTISNFKLLRSNSSGVSVAFKSTSKDPAKAMISTINGQVLKTQSYDGIWADQQALIEFEGFSLDSGIYIISIQQGNEILSKKVSIFR